MNTSELIKKVNASMARQCSEHGYAAPVDVLMDIGTLFAVTVSAKDSLLLFIATFLVSPVGIPLLAAHIVMGLDSIRFALRQFICG